MMQHVFDVNDGRERIMRDEMPDGARETPVVTVRDSEEIPVYIATVTMLCGDLGRPD